MDKPVLRTAGEPFQQETQKLLWDWCQPRVATMSVDDFNSLLDLLEKALLVVRALTGALYSVKDPRRKGRELAAMCKKWDPTFRALKVITRPADSEIDLEIDRYRVQALLDCFEFTVTQLS